MTHPLLLLLLLLKVTDSSSRHGGRLVEVGHVVCGRDGRSRTGVVGVGVAGDDVWWKVSQDFSLLLFTLPTTTGKANKLRNKKK